MPRSMDGGDRGVQMDREIDKCIEGVFLCSFCHAQSIEPENSVRYVLLSEREEEGGTINWLIRKVLP